MPGASEGGPGRRRWPAAALAGLIGWVALWSLADPAGSLGDWLRLRGPVPGTLGALSKAHLVLVAVILVIAHFVLRMPPEGGPIAPETPGEGAEGQESGPPGEDPETGSPAPG